MKQMYLMLNGKMRNTNVELRSSSHFVFESTIPTSEHSALTLRSMHPESTIFLGGNLANRPALNFPDQTFGRFITGGMTSFTLSQFTDLNAQVLVQNPDPSGIIVDVTQAQICFNRWAFQQAMQRDPNYDTYASYNEGYCYQGEWFDEIPARELCDARGAQ